MKNIEDKDEQEEFEKRLKWAKFIAENPDVFNAALKGISQAHYDAEMNKALEKDFAPEPLTEEDYSRLENIQKEYLPELQGQYGDKENSSVEGINPPKEQRTADEPFEEYNSVERRLEGESAEKESLPARTKEEEDAEKEQSPHWVSPSSPEQKPNEQQKAMQKQRDRDEGR